MRKYVYITFLFMFSFFIGYINVFANACTSSEKVQINNDASMVQADYSLKKENGEYVFYISIYNITKNIKVRYSSNSESETEYGVIDLERTNNGTYIFSTKNTSQIVTYTFYVLSNSSCDEYEIRTFTLIKPMRNTYHDEELCQYEVTQDFYYCKEWIKNEITQDKDYVLEQIQNKIDSDSEKTKDNQKNEIVNNDKKTISNQKIIIISVIGGLIVLIIVLIIIKIIRIKRYEI